MIYNAWRYRSLRKEIYMRNTTIGLSLLFTTFLALSADASILNLKMAKEFDSNVQLAVNATETVTGANKTLTMAGEGLRKKKKDFINWNVYVAQFFAEKPEAFVRNTDGALASLNNVGVRALQLTFLRNVAITDITESFLSGLNANLITDQATYQNDVNNFINMVNSGSDAMTGSAMTLFAYTMADGTEVFVYEDCNGKSQTLKSLSAGFANKVFAIWFGNIPAGDQGLFNLENWLMNVPSVTPAE